MPAGSEYIGSIISKKFDGEIYLGKIDRYDAKTKLWHVQYNDGDEEELGLKEVKAGIKLQGGSSTKPSKAPKNSKPAGSEAYIGSAIAKKFDGQIYHGKIDRYDAKTNLWHVTYSDGDEEELGSREVQAGIKLEGGSSKSPPKAPKSSPKERTAAFRVVKASYPSGNGCYAGRDLDSDYIAACTTKRTIGTYDTRAKANKAAWNEMRHQCQFEDWGEEHFEGQDPPYSSSAGPMEVTADEDDYVDIYVVDMGKESLSKKRELEQAKASKPPKKARTAAVKSPADRRFGATKQAIKADECIFARNPCRIAGGTVHPPSKYPNSRSGTGSFQYLIQRISDRNYAMRAFCLDGAGATYNSFKKSNVMSRSVVWMPPTNLNDFGEDESILDAVHLDLISPTNGQCQLTPDDLQAATGPGVQCLFLNGYQDNSFANFIAEPDAIPSAIRACPNIECLALSECLLTKDILEAVTKCSNLKGLILDTMQVKKDATDKGLAAALRACPKLSWLFVASDIFDERCWAELARDGSLPNLEVLWIDSTKSGGGRYGISRGDHSTIETALTRRSASLKLHMINPDEKLKSRYIIDGTKKTNRLEGDKHAPMPSFEDDYDY